MGPSVSGVVLREPSLIAQAAGPRITTNRVGRVSEKALLPLGFCRECGQDYYSVWIPTAGAPGTRVFAPRDPGERLEEVLPRLDEDGLRELIAARHPLSVDDVDRLVGQRARYLGDEIGRVLEDVAEALLAEPELFLGVLLRGGGQLWLDDFALGVVPLATGLAGWCALYSLLGIDSCKVRT